MVLLGFMIILAAAALTAAGVGLRQRWIVVAVPSVLFGGLSYFFISVYAARFKGVGRFYSLPFGGYTVDDFSIAASTLFWAGVWAVALHLLIPRWGREAREKRASRLKLSEIAARVPLSLAPLALTPLLGWLISAGYLNFGGGCKDIVMIFPWMGWSLVYFIFFVSMAIKKASIKRSLAWSAVGATGIMAFVFIAIFAWSLLGVG